ncbi:hypothetical protein SRB521_01257 [Intestinimonas butyriciproducens]|nr:hypothetical protein SRB521_01257 [Intestinimonas butyriciproducens]
MVFYHSADAKTRRTAGTPYLDTAPSLNLLFVSGRGLHIN